MLHFVGKKMSIRVSILVGVASAAVFFLIQKYLLGWPYPWDIFVTLAVMALATSIAILISRSARLASKTGAKFISDNKIKRDLDANIEGLEMSEAPEKVMSDNKVGGDAKFEIKNTKL